jgi:hypothetical protein
MATLSSSTGPAGRTAGPTFRVSTREISLDLTNVGPAESPNELGALSDTAFRELLARFASIPAVKLLDGDPQLVVSAKRGRYVLVPSAGQLLVRPANDSQQPYVKFTADDLPRYLDSTDQPGQSSTKNIQTLIGAASATRSPVVPENAPIYGNIPVSRPSASAPASAPALAASADAPPVRRGLVYAVATILVLAAAGAGWVFYGPAEPTPPPPARALSEFDVVSSADLVASLKKRFVGTYATSGDAGERLLEINADGTFRYQEFGAGVSTTANRKGTYTFALRADNKAPVIRASTLGTIELRDEKNLLYAGFTYTRLP